MIPVSTEIEEYLSFRLIDEKELSNPWEKKVEGTYSKLKELEALLEGKGMREEKRMLLGEIKKAIGIWAFVKARLGGKVNVLATKEFPSSMGMGTCLSSDFPFLTLVEKEKGKGIFLLSDKGVLLCNEIYKNTSSV